MKVLKRIGSTWLFQQPQTVSEPRLFEFSDDNSGVAKKQAFYSIGKAFSNVAKGSISECRRIFENVDYFEHKGIRKIDFSVVFFKPQVKSWTAEPEMLQLLAIM